MRMKTLAWTGAIVCVIAAVLAMSMSVAAQSPARQEPGDAAVAALVTEIRALRADMAAAARNQLRAQLLLGRVQMQEQRLAYLDKQRTDIATQLATQAQMASTLRNQLRGFEGGGCAGAPPEQRRDCEAMTDTFKGQLADQEQREQQLRMQENEIANALSAEQARWSEFNARLDELERSLR